MRIDAGTVVAPATIGGGRWDWKWTEQKETAQENKNGGSEWGQDNQGGYGCMAMVSCMFLLEIFAGVFKCPSIVALFISITSQKAYGL